MKLIYLFISICLAVIGGTLQADEPRRNLTGGITSDAGAPVAKAKVFVYTASPKQGTSSFCPFCYADCSKHAVATADGQFKISSLDPALKFRLLIVAEGYQSKFVSDVDPAQGPQAITLKQLSVADLQSPLRIKGVVVGENGQPVAGATISPEGVGFGDMTQWGGQDRFVEPLAVADEQGRFILFCKTNTVTSISATAEGNGVAKQWITLKPGGDYFVRLPLGTTVNGTLVKAGKPVAGAEIAAATTDRVCGRYFQGYSATTDGAGHFTLINLPPEREFVVYTVMDSLRERGALPPTKFTTGASTTSLNLGELVLLPALKLIGRIVLTDGKKIPAGTKILLGCEQAWDNSETELDAEGNFEFSGLSAESISLNTRIPGYKFSQRNPSLDWLNGIIMGQISAATPKLTLLMDPGQWNYRDREQPPDGGPEQPRDLPLRGLTE